MSGELLAGGVLLACALIALREAVQARRHRELAALLRRIAERNGKNGPGSAAPPSAAGSGPGSSPSG